MLRGADHWPEGSIGSETKRTFDENGVLRDTFTRIEDGEWVPGHIQEFIGRDPADELPMIEAGS